MSTVLIVDSSAVTCHTVSKQLRTYGFDTLQARSIGSARAVLASKPVDLIILGLAGPDAGAPTPAMQASVAPGAQALTALLRELRKTPVIILTSSTRDSDRIDARAGGAAAFLTKPVSTRELVITVNSVLTLHAPVVQAPATAGAARQVPAGVASAVSPAGKPQRRDARPEWAAGTAGAGTVVPPTQPAL